MSAPRTTRTRVGRPSQAEAARLAERLRKAAFETFLECGFDATTMEAVARAADVTKRTLYARYPDKRALFADVTSWALARRHGDEPLPEIEGDDLAAGLTAIARATLARAVDPDIVRISRMAMTESARFPEFARSAQTLAWSPRMRAVMDLLRRHADSGAVVVDDIEIAAEQFLALVAAVPARLAAFGVTRAPEVEERHVQHAVALFLRGVLPR
ncbi:TetR/AcrR family transcriptional regulator [Streptomyces sp. NPDC002896]|uniref:TetR/AcrR family transcriptional regulator n=1 Tax=Streptomyces sp. NPDC002896 TaxID=3154438 RepID=UPI0033308028